MSSGSNGPIVHSISDLGKGPPATSNHPIYATTGWRNDLRPQALNVQAFGAIGDGVTDDTAAIQAAQTEAGTKWSLEFPPDATYLVTDTISTGSGQGGCAWRGARSERGVNSTIAVNAHLPSVKILFRPADTTKWLVSKYDTSTVGGTVGPFIFHDLAFDLGDANGLRFGLNGNTSQRYVQCPTIRRCSFNMTKAANNALYVSDANGVFVRTNRFAIDLAYAYEGTIKDTSFFGGDAHVRGWAVDTLSIENVRSNFAQLPFDFTGASVGGITPRLHNVQVEGFHFTPLRMADISVHVSNLRFETFDYVPGTGMGRFALPQTAAVVAASPSLTFSSDMTDILFPGLSLIELTDGTNIDTALVTAVSGATVTVESRGFEFDWSAPAATVTRIHGYGPIKIGNGAVGMTNISPAVAATAPPFVMAGSSRPYAIANAGRDLGTAGVESLAIGNRYDALSGNRNGVMSFVGCSPNILPDPGHPLVRVVDWRQSHGFIYGQSSGTDAHTHRGFLGDLAEEAAHIKRRWLYTPKSGAAGVASQNYALKFKKIAGDDASTQTYWAWKVPASSAFQLNDTTLPSATNQRWRLRFRARALTTTHTRTAQAAGAGSAVTLGTFDLTTTWKTYDIAFPTPASWTVAAGRTTATVVNLHLLASVTDGMYLSGVDLEAITSSEPAVSADNGDAAKTLIANADESTQIWNTPLTAARAITLSTTGASNGAKFRVVRTAASTGAFNLNLGTGPLKALAVGQWADVEFDTAWRLSASGAL